MNILFFLTPQINVAYIYDNYSLRQVLEKMEYHKYSCIPVIGVDGKYVGTITEGDLLWGLKERGAFDLKKAEEVPIRSFERRMDYAPVRIESHMEDLLHKALRQNFVPVIYALLLRIGIVTRRDIMMYMASAGRKSKTESKKVYMETVG